MPDNSAQADSPQVNLSAAEAGQRLREAREAAGISLTEVNSRIHLTHEVVAALETGQFAAIGPPVFVRGHLRSYARLLRLPEQPILASCPDEETEPEVFRTQSALKQYNPGFSIVNAGLLAGLALLLLIALIYGLFGGDDEVADPAAPGPVAGMVSSARANGNNTDLFLLPESTSSGQLKA